MVQKWLVFFEKKKKSKFAKRKNEREVRERQTCLTTIAGPDLEFLLQKQKSSLFQVGYIKFRFRDWM